jgi:HD-GYP domain-containing protein (c-di-GMP phosphodiesterase class II)
MTILSLQFPVITPDREELLPAGTELTPETMADLISRSADEPFEVKPLMRYGWVSEDIRRIFSMAPYAMLFSERRKTDDLVRLMEGVELPLSILKCLDYFKRYDPYTYRHVLVVFALSLLLAREFIENEQDLRQKALAATAHDFGKVSVPLGVLQKSSPLTVDERRHLDHHTVAGYVLLSYYFRDADNLAAKTARDHHERRDGSGYPSGRLFEDSMVEIVAVCDVYDALISQRPYRPTSFDNRTALEEITRMAEKGQFKKELVQALISYNRKGHPHYATVTISQKKRGSTPADNLYGLISEKKG